MDSLSVHGYTPAAGLPEARAAIAQDLNDRYKASLHMNNIFFTCGAAPALVSVIRALATEQSEFVCIAPYFPEYRPFVEMNGATFVAVSPDTEHFQINLEALESQIGIHTQALILNCPNNPSGVVYSTETLRNLSAILKQKFMASLPFKKSRIVLDKIDRICYNQNTESTIDCSILHHFPLVNVDLEEFYAKIKSTTNLPVSQPSRTAKLNTVRSAPRPPIRSGTTSPTGILSIRWGLRLQIFCMLISAFLLTT